VVSEFGGLDLLASNAGVEHFGALETITQADDCGLNAPCS
jgi:3-oxoacyl-[acyl-carrier protein] reductase/tetrahydroxynaphthalene reductase